MPFPPVQRRAARLLLCLGIYSAGWWHHHLLHPQPPPALAGHATAQLPPSSAHPPGYLTSKAPTAPPAAGAEALAKLLEQRAKPEDLATALATWAEQDPDAAFRALLADPRLQLPATARALFEVLGKNDPTQALQRLAQLPALPWARDANIGLSIGWTQRDPQAATTAGLALSPGLPRTDFLSAAFGQWAKQDFLAAHDWVLSLPPEESRARILTIKALEGAEIHNPQDMTAFLEFSQQNLDPFVDEIPGPFYRWAEKSPDDALHWALALPQEGIFNLRFLSAALAPLAADPARVLSLLSQLNDPSARINLVAFAADAWAQRDPASAWAWGAQLTDPSLRESFENRLTEQWTEQDPGTAIPWLLKNHSNYLQTIDSRILYSWAEATPDAALALLGQLPAKDTHENLVSGLLEGVARAKPQLALSQLDLLQDIKQRGLVIYQAMTTWGEQDISAASAYTEALPPGEDQQEAIKGILFAAYKNSPESAFTWALTLTNPEDKAREIESLLQNWQRKDPAAAQNWLDHAPLDDDLRQKLTPSQP